MRPARSAVDRACRSNRVRWSRSRALPLFSAAVGLRPVRPRDSTKPAALPRCLVWRLRLVWATPRSLVRSRSRGTQGRSPVGGCRAGSPRALRAARARRARRSRSAAWRAHTLDHQRKRNIERALDVHRDLRQPRRRAATPIARRPGSPSATALADQRPRSARASATVAGGASSRLNATSGGRARRRASRRRSGAGGAGRSRAASSPAAMRRASPATPPRRSSRAGAPAGKLAVEEHGNGQLRADPVGHDKRLDAEPRRGRARRDRRRGATSSAPTCGCSPRGSEPPEPEITSIRATASPAPATSASQSASGAPRQREDRTVMVGVGVDVEQPDCAPAGERARRSLARHRVAPLGDVGNGQQEGCSRRGGHGPQRGASRVITKLRQPRRSSSAG